MKESLTIIIVIALLFVFYISCNTPTPYEPTEQEKQYLKLLTAYMTAYLNNTTQYNANPGQFAHIDLRQKMIWADSYDEKTYWIYVEQGVSGSAPYRQRVYKLEVTGEGEYASHVYDFDSEIDRQNSVGAWNDDNPLSDLNEYDFYYKSGCTTYLNIVDPTTEIVFEGGTKGKDCEGNYQGTPSYTTTEVTIRADGMDSLDQIYSQETDEQIGGSTNGPYLFDMIENYNPELDFEE